MHKAVGAQHPAPLQIGNENLQRYLVLRARNTERVSGFVIPGKAVGRDPESSAPPLDSGFRRNDGRRAQNPLRNYCAWYLVRRRQRLCLFQLHIFVAAIEFASTRLIAQYFRATRFAEITFAELVCHNSLLISMYVRWVSEQTVTL